MTMHRIVRRTLTGGALALTVALLLVWTSRSADGRPILYAGAAILLLAVFETSRMGSLALRELLPALLVAACGVVLLARDGGPVHTLYAWAGSLAAAAYALNFSLRRVVRDRSTPRAVTYLLLGAVLLYVPPGTGLLVLLVATAVLLPFVLTKPDGGRGLAIAVLLAVWIVPPLPALWHVWDRWAIGGLVAFLVCAKIGDTAGYYVGNAIGRHHPFPRISPGKTTEGCLGSLAAGTAAGGAFVALDLLPGDLVHGLLAGAVVNVAAQAGDLLESFVKRRVGVKDSSTMLGPSGGVLDQIDSLLLAVPVALLVWPILLPVSPP